MNLILLRPEGILNSNGSLTFEILDKTTINHLKNVLRVNVGKILKVGVVNSIQDYATVETIGSDSITIKLSDKFNINLPPPRIPVIDLVVGIPRPKSLDKLLQYSSSIGVGRIDLVCSSRVEKSYLVSHKLTKESIEDSLILGLQQGVDTLMPEVKIFQSLGEYSRCFRPEHYSLKLIAHPESVETLGSLRLHNHTKGPIIVAIGPEGGWLDHELEFYTKLGFVQFRLCSRILRTEVAAVAILSQLDLLLNDTTLRDGLSPAVR